MINLAFLFLCFLNMMPETIAQGVERIRMPNSGITDITTVELPENTQSLYLDGNHVEVIPSNYFVNLPIIRKISLEYNDIQIIQEYAFEKVPSLTKLLLKGNVLSSVTRYMFSGLFNLTELDLGKNRISAIEDGSFFDMKKIAELQLQKNQLETISSRVFDRKDLPIGLKVRLIGNPLICDWRLLGLYDAIHSGQVFLRNEEIVTCQFGSNEVLLMNTTWGNITKTDLQAAGEYGYKGWSHTPYN